MLGKFFKKVHLRYTCLSLVFVFLIFLCVSVRGASALTENDFSFNLHAPYNFGGDLFPGAQIRTEGFWNYMDKNICELDSISSENCGPVKVSGIEVIRDGGQTGIVPKKVSDSQCAVGDNPPCFTDQLDVAGSWSWIDGPVRHQANLGLKTQMDIGLWEMWWDHPGGAISYTEEIADINALISLARKAIKRYDGDCDVNDNGNCTDLYEGTQENPSITYPKILFWQIVNEPGNNNWKMDNTINVGGRQVMALAYTINEISKIIKGDCPDCKVVLSGVGGDSRINFYQQFIYGPLDGIVCTYNPCGYYRKLIEDLNYLKTASQGTNFDVFDFHHHNQQNINDTAWYQVKPKFDIIRRLLNETGHSDIPIWITETSSWTGSPNAEAWGGGVPYPNHTSEQQAAEIVKRYVYPFSLGVKKIFWSPSIIDTNYNGISTGYFSNIGLIYRDGIKKIPSFITYQLMVSKLKTFTAVTRANMDDTNIYLFKFEFGAGGKPPAYVIWKENGSANVNLTGKITPPIIVTNLRGEITGETISQISVDSFPKFIETSSAPTATPTPNCPNGEKGDLNCDGVINNEDLSILNSAWTTSGPVVIPPDARRSPDLNGDSRVDEIDMNTLMRNWAP